MVAPRKKKHSINQLLLRRAVSRTKPSKLPVSAAQGGLPLYDVYEPRCGISVRPSIARDSHLVHIMQSSLPSKARKIRSRRNFRSSPHRNTERMSSEGGKKIKTLLQPWRKLQQVAMPSSHSMKPRSRASSVGYPSSWNFETPRNENVIIMQEHNQHTRKPLGRFNDSSIQCTLKSSQTRTRSKGSAQTQTTLDPDLPTENSSQIELNSHQLQQRHLSPTTIAEMNRLLIRNPLVPKTSRKPEMQPHRVFSGDASYSIPSYQKKKNYGGYTPSEVSSETMRKSMDIETQPSERLSRIEKISLPPSTNGRKTKVNHWNSGMKCACAATISRKSRPACNCDEVKKPGGTWRLRLASRDELKSYEEAEMVDTCPISCGENRHTMDLSQWDQGIRPSDPYKKMRRSGQYKENELSENSQDSEHSASEMDENKNLMRTGVPEHRSSSGLSKRNVGFEHGQFNCCQCANAETQTLRKGSMAGKSSKETEDFKDCNCRCDDQEIIAETEQELPEDTALKSPKQSDMSSEERGSRSRTSKKSLDSVKLKKSTSNKSLDLDNSSRKSFNADKSRKSLSSVEDDFENRKSYYENKPRKSAKSTADDFKNRKLNYGDKSQNSSSPNADDFENRKSFYADKSRKSAKSTVNDDENRKSFYGDKSRKSSKSVANDFENKRLVYGDKSRNSTKSTVNDFENRKSFNGGKSRKSSSPTDKGFANPKSFYGDKSRKSSSPTADDFENRKSFYGNKSRKSQDSSPTGDDFENRKSFYGNKSRNSQDSSPTADDFENRKSSYKDKSRNSASPTADDFRNSNTTGLDYGNLTCEYPQCPACCCWNQCWNNYPTCLYNQSCYSQQQDAMKNNYQNRNNYQMTCKCATATTQTSYTSKVLQKNRKDAQKDPQHASEPDDPQRNRRVSYTGSDSSPTSQEPTAAEVDNANKNSVREKVPIDSKNEEVKCNCKCPNCGILFNTKPNMKADKISTHKRNSNARPEATTISDSNQIPVRPTTPENTTVPTPLTTRTMIGSDKKSNEFNNNTTENCRTNPRCIAANCGQSFDNSNQFNNSNVSNAAIDENCNVNQIIEILQKTVVGLEEQKKILSQAVRNLNTNQNNSNNLAEDFPDENDEGKLPPRKR
ncbi:probable cyclin-dependent serine/threonine-protein kinase DDB_G0292550 [Drosophila sulfurigaster albostrigata]|uniref:probable cyclin-dependent serine/threonine-protein kinase DDB_G0292550 n=1 Tax=Drosophila sulfurigaster albostrigata TaxID=89887 RepID=UPI002D21A53D|nr:probable cyclin-dependent serine/threonine-protein kinase DDB_G0292550 [Drosophila sulfurigaster albostrigata]